MTLIAALWRVLAGLVAFLALSAFAQPATVFWAAIAGGGPELVLEARAPAFTISVPQNSPTNVSVLVQQGGNFPANVGFVAPAGTTLQPGTYEYASSDTISAKANLARSCYPGGRARFNILELQLDSSFQVVSFAANFQVPCSGGGDVLYGEVRVNSAVPLTIEKAPSFATPDAFGFLRRDQAPLASVQASNEVTLYGMRASAPLSVVGGEYSLNGGPWTNANTFANNRDRVRVRTTAANAVATTRSVTLNVGGVVATFDVRTYAPGTPDTVAAYTAEAASSTPSRTVEMRGPEWTVEASHDRGNSVTFTWRRPTNPGFEYTTLRFGAPGLAPLAVGPYESAQQVGYGAVSPLIHMSGTTEECVSGRFVVRDVALGTSGLVNRFAVDFDCSSFYGRRITGQLRYASPEPLWSQEQGVDATPEAFAFETQSPVRAGALVTSNVVSVLGTNVPVPVSIAGGQYSLNGGAFTSAAGTAQPRDQVVVRMQAPRTAGAAASATLTLGGRQATLSVSTYQPGQVLSGLYFNSTSGDYAGAGRTRLLLAPPNRLTAGPYGVGVEGPGLLVYNVFVNAAGNAPLAPGVYENTGRMPSPTQPQLDFFGDGRGCNQTFGRFTVREIAYDSSQVPTRLAIDFEQHCESPGAPPLFGELRVNSTVPFSALEGNTCVPGDADGDGVPDCVELDEGRNPMEKDNDIFANARLFAMQQYRDFLVREGDAGGIDAWTTQIATGRMSRGAVIESFFNSNEFQGTISPVTRLYFAYFLRIPDYSGLGYWIDQYKTGTPLASISQAFASSPEFTNRYGALDNGAFVDLVYDNVLGRDPDPGGKAYWQGQLDSAQMTRGQVMLGFSESPEYRGNIAGEVFVTMTYIGMLRRAPDPGGFQFWVGQLDQGQSGQGLIDGFLAAQEYRSRFLP